MTSGDLKLKVCGMRDPENTRKVASMGPDYMGFIFYEKSPRYVGDGFQIPDAMTFGVSRVGVFVNSPVEEIRRLSRSGNMSLVQLHGNETPEDCAALREADLKVIKAFGVDDAFDFARTKPYESAVDYFLFDTKGRYYGGNASAFNWKVLARYDQKIPFFLSGGLSPENIGGVRDLLHMNVHAIDVNSGVESAPGVKDVEKVKKVYDFVRAIKH